ncbi:GNAT family N-acetyltransferase [Epidermidibacterium keratini]|uniref:GNAT family N-acetyltransferase n=1 Tax=Epidermidibacterium keratini TaxID=1891644 RepID=A0A7L4YTD0_9ACTN|nr:GNAT family N-acetyltransferase [Epidermidibacterium keratini]
MRRARPQDVPRLIELVRELARYERAEHEALATEQQLHTSLFGEQPAVYALVAEREPGGEIVGCAIWFLNFSTWLGIHGIYLEDLFVSESERGTGLGKALLQSLAKIAAANGLGRVEWSVLKWNTPSIDFYRAIGAVAMDEWDTMRLTGKALDDFAADAQTSRP